MAGWNSKLVGCVCAMCITSILCLQVKSGTIFDNVLVTDDVDYAKQVAEETWAVTKKGEKEMKDKVSDVLCPSHGFIFGSKKGGTHHLL